MKPSGSRMNGITLPKKGMQYGTVGGLFPLSCLWMMSCAVTVVEIHVANRQDRIPYTK